MDAAEGLNICLPTNITYGYIARKPIPQYYRDQFSSEYTLATAWKNRALLEPE